MNRVHAAASLAALALLACNLQIEDGCRRMRGELVVKPRQ